jgi:dihydroorotase
MVVADGRLVEVVPAGVRTWQPDEVMVRDCAVSLGWVDLRVYLTDPGFEYKDSLERIAASAHAGGFTAVLGHPTTQPATDHRDLVRALIHRAEALPVRILPAGTLTEGGKGKHLSEMYDMAQAGAIAFSDGDRAIADAGLLMRALLYSQPFGGIIFDLPIDASVAGGSMVAESEQSVRMGLIGIPPLAEELALDRDLAVLRYAQGRLHLGPVSTQHGVNLLRANRGTLPFTADTTALHLYYTDEDLSSFDTSLKVFPPLAPPAAREALLNAVADGTISAISSGHKPQGTEEKRTDFVEAEFGALGLEAAFGAAWYALESRMSLSDLVDRFTHGPRAVLGLPDQKLEEGQDLDLTFFDPNPLWVFEQQHSRSSGVNQPFMGKVLKGRAIGTSVRGQYHKI